MRIEEGIKLDFQDVLMVPQRSDVESRSEVELVRSFEFAHSKHQWTGIPVIVANMDVVATFDMVKAMAKHRMMVALHKHYSPESLVDFFLNNKELWEYVFYTVGTSEDDWNKLQIVQKAVGGDFPLFLNIDVANGYTQTFVDTVRKYRATYPNAVIMAGNIVTANMSEELIISGADIVKVGIGGGSVCLSRVKAGIGYPQLSAVDECGFVAHGKPHGHICSDGGCRTPGDLAKAFAAGADFCMIGGMVSGTDECDGDWEYDDDGKKKSLMFYGMSSDYAQKKHGGDLAYYRASEGRVVEVPYKGPVEGVIRDILGGVRSACTYTGASRLKDLPKCASFVRVNRTHNTIFEK